MGCGGAAARSRAAARASGACPGRPATGRPASAPLATAKCASPFQTLGFKYYPDNPEQDLRAPLTFLMLWFTAQGATVAPVRAAQAPACISEVLLVAD